MTFKEWLAEVNTFLVALCGMGSDDLPDQDYWNMWNDEVDPEDAATEILDNEGFFAQF